MAGMISKIPIRVPPASRDYGIEILLQASEAAAEHTLDFSALMEALTALVRKIVKLELFCVLVPGKDGALSIAHSVGHDPDLARTLRVPVGQGVTGSAALTKAPVRVDDVSTEPNYLPVVEGVQSELAVPLLARGRVVAVLDLQSADPDAFDQRVSDLLELVASRFSLAIDVAQLYESQSRQHSKLQMLRQIASEFSQILQLEELLQKIAALVRDIMPYDVLAIYLKDPHGTSLRHYFGIQKDKRVRWRDLESGRGLVGTAAALRKAVLVADTRKDDRYLEFSRGVLSEVAIPLILKSNLIGVLDLESTALARFTEEDIDTLTLLAPQIATAIENARLFEELRRDLVAARDLQRHMLPTSKLRLQGMDVAARNEPASVVSGDFFDYYAHGERLAVLNGDVSGKGAAAALYAALASGLIRTAATPGRLPGEILGCVNELLLDRKIDARFVAAVLASWDSATQRLTIAAAGMPYVYVCQGGTVVSAEASGVPMGLLRGTTYEEVSFDLSTGDFAVTLSDGFEESVNSAGETYGRERSLAVLSEHQGESAESILDRLFEDVSEFCDGFPQTDDRTAVVMRVEP